MHPRLLLLSSAACLAACAHAPPTSPSVAPVSTTLLTSTTVPTARLSLPDPLSIPAAGPREATPPLSLWAVRYPDAAQQLGEWMTANPETAGELARWQRRHPVQMETLVDWSTTYPSDPLGELLFDKWNWDDLRAIAPGDEDVKGFMTWARHAPHAAREMAVYSNGLAYLRGEMGTLLHASRAAALRVNAPVVSHRHAAEAPSSAPSPR